MTDREFALSWFAAFREVVAPHYLKSWIDDHEAILRRQPRARLRVLRAEWKDRAAFCSDYAIATNEPNHGAQGWTFTWRVNTMLAAIYGLAIGDKGRHEEETGVEGHGHYETGYACNGCGMFSGDEFAPCPNCDEEVSE